MFIRYLLFFVVFFFQAEDGIRDLYVTGVQTCALPICHGAPAGVPPRPRAAAGGRGGTPAGAPWRRGVGGAAAGRLSGVDIKEHGGPSRSEERRVGKEGRCGRWREKAIEDGDGGRDGWE